MDSRTTLCSLLTSLVLVTTAAAQDDTPEIPWTPGPTTGRLGDEARIRVPEGCLFTGTNGVRQFMEVTQNPVGGHERGVVLCQAQDDAWFVVFSFEESGYVRDDAALRSVHEQSDLGPHGPRR